ncbi:MAG: dihydroxyacetone kinase transcriptional activator DhaS, partial [Candidatus Saccharibacteria bacterium]
MIIDGDVMSSVLTKKGLAQSLKQLMQRQPLAKISIQEIVDNCGVNRQTFYYHFQDKYDLVNWIYNTEGVENIEVYNKSDTWVEGISLILHYLMDNRAFYVNALNATGPNTFQEHLLNATHSLIIKVVQELTGDMIIDPLDAKLIASFYTHAFVGVTIQWIKEGMR